jgi:hypothetical protein
LRHPGREVKLNHTVCPELFTVRERSAILATLVNDPPANLLVGLRRCLPILRELFAGMAVLASPGTSPRLLADLEGSADVGHDPALATAPAGERLGHLRVAVLERALAQDGTHVLYCDLDRLLVWAGEQTAELSDALRVIGEADCTVFGRTPPAFRTHPRVQRDTERMANHVYALATGAPWDITAAARGLSRRAAQLIVGADTARFGVGTDAAWPLLLALQHGLSLAYREVDGLRFESAVGSVQDVQLAGGVRSWKRALDGDPLRWAHRLGLAQQEAAAVAHYAFRGPP